MHDASYYSKSNFNEPFITEGLFIRVIRFVNFAVILHVALIRYFPLAANYTFRYNVHS